MAQVFVDSSFYIALANVRDQHHAWAREQVPYLEERNIQQVITRAAMIESGDALSKPRFREQGAALLSSIEDDPSVAIVPLSEELYQRGLELFSQRLDKAWGLTDCISFTVMSDLGIGSALTTDDHFRQAGFTLRSDR